MRVPASRAACSPCMLAMHAVLFFTTYGIQSSQPRGQESVSVPHQTTGKAVHRTAGSASEAAASLGLARGPFARLRFLDINCLIWK
ncbi:hypothetical protein LZ31DRAFT_557701 [Colletotrichum somersetense]|nr:hypothetical protein LZ31DRAFT_557701 [Colletotrichum somersetense]